eukprot:3483387-Rhodomonas_salina.1
MRALVCGKRADACVSVRKARRSVFWCAENAQKCVLVRGKHADARVGVRKKAWRHSTWNGGERIAAVHEIEAQCMKWRGEGRVQRQRRRPCATALRVAQGHGTEGGGRMREEEEGGRKRERREEEEGGGKRAEGGGGKRREEE